VSGFRQLPLPLPHEPSFAREDFLASPSNAAALALIDAWPRWPAPLMLLTGPPGSGKSHLAAIFAGLAGAIRLSGGEVGGLDLDEAVRPPALALDDADRAGDAEAAFFHLLNLTRVRNVAILMTAAAPPDLWGFATPDLISRLRLAPIVEIAPPEPALIEAVLLKLFSDRQIDVEPSVAAYIARRLDRSLGDARAFVDTLDAEALAQGRKVTRTLAAALMKRDAPDESDA
jgi:chromosomal replication initiation ATPase DnaA